MDALLHGLEQPDGALRYKIILALEEMVRRFPKLPIRPEAVERAILAEAKRYCRRFVISYTLFGDGGKTSASGGWLLRQFLVENMERKKERAIRLLSLLHSPEDAQRIFMALQTENRVRQAYAVELLDHLLTGEIKRQLFPLFDDMPDERRFETFLELLELRRFDAKTALEELLREDDVWLRAATIWEIGLREMREFRGKIEDCLNSRHLILKEVAELVLVEV